MSLRDEGYSVLVVSAAENINASISELLPENSCHPTSMASSIGAAREKTEERDFDFIIINSPLPDDFGARFAVNISTSKGTVVLLLVKSDVYADVYDKVAEYGVFVLAKPASKQVVKQALELMAAARAKLRYFEKKTLSVDAKMEELRIVNRAKWMLISEGKMDEPDAHRYIEKQAMDRCTSKRVVAEEIIQRYSL